MQRNRKTLRPDVFAKSEQGVMTTEIFGCRFYAIVDLDLLNARIAFDVKDAIADFSRSSLNSWVPQMFRMASASR